MMTKAMRWAVVGLLVVAVAGQALAYENVTISGDERGVIRGWSGEWEIFKVSSNWADPDMTRSDQMHQTTVPLEGFPKKVDDQTLEFAGTMGEHLQFHHTVVATEEEARVDAEWTAVDAFEMRQLQLTVDLLTTEYGGDRMVIYPPDEEPITIDLPFGMDPMERQYVGPIERVEMQRMGETVLTLTGDDARVHIIDLRQFGGKVVRIAWNVLNSGTPVAIDEGEQFKASIGIDY